MPKGAEKYYRYRAVNPRAGEFDSQSTGLIGLQAGDAVILLPGVWHRYRPHKDTGWGSYWLNFHGSTADRLRAEAAPVE